MKEIIKIYVELLDEGTPVWRPVNAEPQANGTFLICEQSIPAYERWNFLPGERVLVEEQERSGQGVGGGEACGYAGDGIILIHIIDRA